MWYLWAVDLDSLFLTVSVGATRDVNVGKAYQMLIHPPALN